MARSLVQLTNTGTQAVAVDGIISPGAIQRRFGCNCNSLGNSVQIDGVGYYEIDGTVTVAPTAIGTVTVQVYKDGAPLPGVLGSVYAATAAQPVTIPLVGTARIIAPGAAVLTLVLTAGAGDVTNVSLRVSKF